MKESVLDVLMYLFERYMDDELVADADRDKLDDALVAAGFRRNEIVKALDWLDGLSADAGVVKGSQARVAASHRVYSDEECERIDSAGRGFLLSLEQVGALDESTRELVVDRVMALDETDIDLEQLKWVVLMVMFNQPGREDVCSWMEEVVFEGRQNLLH